MLNIFGKILDIIFPRICLKCGRVNAGGNLKYLCEKCESEIEFIDGAKCIRCGEPLYGDSTNSTQTCAKCFGIKFYFEESYCVAVYNNAVSLLVKELKYKSGFYVLGDIAKLFERNGDYYNFVKDSIIIPVPLHRNRMRSRGYNQSLEIAKELCKNGLAKVAYNNKVLVRIKDTKTQTSYDREHRAENMRGAFAITKNCKLAKDAKIILLDDVMTTCATLNECAKVLKNAGYKNIRVMSFAKRPLGL